MLTQNIQKTLNAPVTIRSVEYNFFNHIVLNDVVIGAQNGDTMIYIGRLDAVIHTISVKNRAIRISSINLDRLDFRLWVDTANIINFQYIVDLLEGDPTSTKPSWMFRIRRIALNDGRFSYSRAKPRNVEYGMNFDRMSVQKINAVINKFVKNRKGKLTFDIRYLSAIERSGFTLSDFASHVTIDRKEMKFNDLYAGTPLSKMNISVLRFSHRNYQDWSQGRFIHRVKLMLVLDKSRLHTGDLAFFAPRFHGYTQQIKCSGLASGTIADLKISKLNIRAAENTELLSDLRLTGLPNLKRTFIFHNIHEFITTADDIRQFNPSFFSSKPIDIPAQIDRMGMIRFTGNFTGFINDFVAFGKLSCDQGEVLSDICLKPDTSGLVTINGRIITRNLQTGTIINAKENFNHLNADIDVKGQWSKNDWTVALNGMVNKIHFNTYDYSGIWLNGTIGPRKYNGEFAIRDSNLTMNFKGRFDFSNRIPEFDFTAVVEKANLFPLHFSKRDTMASFQCLAECNVFSIDTVNMNGSVKITDACFTKKDRRLEINNLELLMNTRDDIDQIMLRSDYADGTITGHTHYPSLASGLRHMMSKYIPSWFDSVPALDTMNAFDCIIRTRNMKPVMQFFAPNVDISKNSIIRAHYQPESQTMDFHVSISNASWGSNRFINMNLDVQADTSELDYSLSADSVYLSRQILLESFSTTGTVQADSIRFALLWNNRNPYSNTLGSINATAFLRSNYPKKQPFIFINCMPSAIFYQDSLWILHRNSISIDTTAITFNHVILEKGNERVVVTGKISENKSDKLVINLKDITLEKFNLLLKDKGMMISGKTQGRVELTDYYHEPQFVSDFMIDTLRFNDETLGNTFLSTQWQSNDKCINLNCRSKRGNIVTLDIGGKYYPENKILDAEIHLDKLRLNILNPYLKFMKDIRGMASGFATLKGTGRDPVLNGNLVIQKGAFSIDYLKTRYSFTNSIEIKDNQLLLDNITLFDEDGNKATVNGEVITQRFKQWQFNLSIDSKKFMMLNTQPADNDYYYGKAMGSGLVKISGEPGKVMISVSAKTEDGSRFYIPMKSAESVQKNNFITFYSSTAKPKDDDDEKIILRDTLDASIAGLILDFDLELTPAMEVQIVFDSKMGDLIKGRGNGNLKLNINDKGKFEMFGKYSFTEGDYLFTLQNLINKKFDIQSGSVINWNGDPVDADIDMDAVYKLKTSLASLFNDTSATYKRRVPVECRIHLKGKLLAPEIEYAIVLPTVEPETQNQVASLIVNEDKRSVQFLSLLVLNSFYPDPDLVGAQAGSSSGMGYTGVGVTTSELLSNQLSNWLSKWSGNVDLGVNYRPGDQMMSDEYEVALSTQMFNNRVSIAGNLDMGGQYGTTEQTSSENIVGDFKVDVKLNRSGKLRVQAFNRSNDKLLYEDSRYKQGVGIFYREEFDSFKQVLKQYWNWMTGRSKRTPA